MNKEAPTRGAHSTGHRTQQRRRFLRQLQLHNETTIAAHARKATTLFYLRPRWLSCSPAPHPLIRCDSCRPPRTLVVEEVVQLTMLVVGIQTDDGQRQRAEPAGKGSGGDAADSN